MENATLRGGESWRESYVQWQRQRAADAGRLFRAAMAQPPGSAIRRRWLRDAHLQILDARWRAAVGSGDTDLADLVEHKLRGLRLKNAAGL